MHYYNRKTTRLNKGCYRWPIACFVTFCVEKKYCLFGKVDVDTTALSILGKRIEEIWLDIGRKNTNTDVTNYIVMPNHFHGIIDISGPKEALDDDIMLDKERTKLLGIIRDFKSFSSHEYSNMKESKNLQLWQRGYYDHIIRDEKEYQRIREYIITNPTHWSRDNFYVSY
jgi:putative transposase